MEPLTMSKSFNAPERLEKLKKLARQEGLDVIALVPSHNLIYLTGIHFRMMERSLVLFIPVEGEPQMIIPSLEVPLIAEQPFPIRIHSYTDADGYLPTYERVCKSFAGKKIGVEGMKMRVTEGQLIEQCALGAHVVPADNPIQYFRLHKDAYEIEMLSKAVASAEAALDAVVPEVRPGMTERQIMNMLQNAMVEAGSQGNAFDPIVLSGPNTAQPHGWASERVVREGDLLLFDWGTTHEYYASDLTRTFAVGNINAELTKIYETVLAANEAGIAAAKPGIAAQDVDRAARKVITDAGYGDYFIHRTGHGLGMEGHEGPYMREGNDQILEPGMCFTVEPGIYVPGVGGVRIEDDVTITPDGAKVLTSYPKKLRKIGV
jgi:Xaa-Pro dipeptidase